MSKIVLAHRGIVTIRQIRRLSGWHHLYQPASEQHPNSLKTASRGCSEAVCMLFSVDEVRRDVSTIEPYEITKASRSSHCDVGTPVRQVSFKCVTAQEEEKRGVDAATTLIHRWLRKR